MKKSEDCVSAGGIMGVYFGGLVGASLGWLAGGWLGAVGFGLAGAGVGLLVGMGVGWLVCFLIETFGGGSHGVSFAVPRFSNLRLEATPNPARRGQPCRLTLHMNVDGNDDRALCEIEWHIFAEQGAPTESPIAVPVRSNATSFGRGVAYVTTWSVEHDGREVSASVVLEASLGAEFHRFEEKPQPIRVPVIP